MARFFKILLRSLVTLIVLLAFAVATRRYWVPERFAVNVPMRSLLGNAAKAA